MIRNIASFAIPKSNNDMQPKEIKINYTPSSKLKYYTAEASGEVSGLGKSIIDEEGNIIIEDVYLFEQTCSGAGTDLDEESMAKFLYKLHQDGEDISKWNVWWHTHADFGVFWSSTDTGTIKSNAGMLPYLVSIVTNKKNEFLGRIDVFPEDKSPFKVESQYTYNLKVATLPNDEIESEIQINIDDLEDLKKLAQAEIDEANKQIEEFKSLLYENPEIKEDCIAEVKAKVKARYIVPVTTGYYHRNIYHQNQNTRLFDDYANDHGTYYKKKAEKRKGYFERNDERENEFESILFEIFNGLDNVELIGQSSMEEFDQKLAEIKDDMDIIELNDDVPYCPECQNPMDVCTCDSWDVDSYRLNSFINNKDIII